MTENKLSRPIIKKGWFSTTYDNPWEVQKSTWPAFKSLIVTKRAKLPSIEELDKNLPVKCGDLSAFQNPQKTGLKYMWIGHASCLVQVDGINIITDPIFSQRASFVQFAGPKRYRPPACQVKDLPELDAVVISHNHYDHLDYGSVTDLYKRFGDTLHWYVPMGLKQWMRKNVGVANDSVTELLWWQTAELSKSGERVQEAQEPVKFVFTPAQHWCTRNGSTDRNKVLWGSWTVIGPKHRFYFTGDTAYCPVFKEIGQEYGPFDLAAIPIGAYAPRAFMKNMHVDPEEAVKLHEDIQSKKSVGIHWATFDLSYEHYLAPSEELAEHMEKSDKSKPFDTVKHGEILEIS